MGPDDDDDDLLEEERADGTFELHQDDVDEEEEEEEEDENDSDDDVVMVGEKRRKKAKKSDNKSKQKRKASKGMFLFLPVPCIGAKEDSVLMSCAGLDAGRTSSSSIVIDSDEEIEALKGSRKHMRTNVESDDEQELGMLFSDSDSIA